MAIFDVPQRFSQKWVHDKVPTMDSTEFHAMFHEAATRGWDEERVRKLAKHYRHQAEDEQVAEHEAAFQADNQTVMVVPTEMVPAIVKLLNKKRPA